MLPVRSLCAVLKQVVTGTYSDPQGGNIDFQLGGPNSLSLLDVTGAASFTGSRFEVSLINGFHPTNGETFEIMASAGLGGTMFMNPTFQVGNLTFTASYINNDTDVLLTVSGSAVPEPAALVMLGLGVAGIAVFMARKSQLTGRS